MGPGGLLGGLAVTVQDRGQHVAVLGDRLLEAPHPLQAQEPQPQAQSQVLTEGLLEVAVVGSAMDTVGYPLVQADQGPDGLVAAWTRWNTTGSIALTITNRKSISLNSNQMTIL